MNNNPRPLVEFDGDSRKTARIYASDLYSRVNKPETNEILAAIAHGESVDAYDAAVAVLDAMRRVGTRFGQSTQRRQYGKAAAHLGHIIHSVLANHADGLPAYAEGDRSRRIEELERLLAEEKAGRLTAQERAEDLSSALAEAQARAGAQEATIATMQAAMRTARIELDKSTEFVQAKGEQLKVAHRQQAQIAGVLSERNDRIADLEAEVATVTEERDTLAAVVAYVLERIEDPAEQQRIFGFWDGVAH